MRDWIAALFLFGLLVSSGAAVGQQSPALALKTRIPLTHVNGRMDHLAVDLKGQRLFATAFYNHTVEVIDLRAGQRVHTIANLAEPQGLFYDAATDHLFVASSMDGTVRILDGRTFETLTTVKLAADADNIRYNDRGHGVVVGYGGEKFLRGKPVRGQGDGALAFLDSTGKKTGEIAMDAHPESFQLERNGSRVFANVPDHHEIEVADAVKGTVLAKWPVTTCTDNFPMSLDEVHHRLFIGCRTPASLLVFDTESGKTVASLETLSSDDIFYDASKSRVYVVGEGSIDAFQQKDADHYAKIARYPTAPGLDAGTGFFVADWGKLFVSLPGGDKRNAEILVYETK